MIDLRASRSAADRSRDRCLIEILCAQLAASEGLHTPMVDKPQRPL
jgi:hypothetical protein